MNAITNDAIRQKVLKALVETANNVYLVFSDSGSPRPSPGTPNPRTTNAELGTPVYAIRLDNDIEPMLHYAIKNTFGATGIYVEVNGKEYIVNDNIDTQLDKLWNGLYFNVDIAVAGGLEYNIVTVLIDLQSSVGAYAEAATITSFSANAFDVATIIVQALPADAVLPTTTTDFPCLISF